MVNKGYYTVARRYGILFSSDENNILRMSKILFSSREDEIHIFKAPCHFLFIIYRFNAKSGK